MLKADGVLNWKAEYSLKAPGTIVSVSSPVQTPDGGFVTTGSGYVTSGGSYHYGFIAKIDSMRNIAFQNHIGRTYEYGAQAGESVFTTPDGGYFVFGSSYGGRQEDFVVLKLDSEGVHPWL